MDVQRRQVLGGRRIGIAGIMIAPERILLLPEAETASGPLDPVFDHCEEARGFLHILTIFMSFWRDSGIGASLGRFGQPRSSQTMG